MAAAAQVPASGVVVDRVAGVLNGQAITASEVEDAARFARLSAALSGSGASASAAATCATVSAADRQSALQHLIDERLLLDSAERSGYAPATPAAVEAAVAHYRQLAGGAAALQSRLTVCGIDADTLRQLLAGQTTILAYLDDRLGASIEPDDASVRQYYTSTFVPEARTQGLTPAPLPAVRPQIVAILREQRLAKEEDELLETLRDAAQIRIVEAPVGGGA